MHYRRGVAVFCLFVWVVCFGLVLILANCSVFQTTMSDFTGMSWTQTSVDRKPVKKLQLMKLQKWQAVEYGLLLLWNEVTWGGFSHSINHAWVTTVASLVLAENNTDIWPCTVNDLFFSVKNGRFTLWGSDSLKDWVAFFLLRLFTMDYLRLTQLLMYFKDCRFALAQLTSSIKNRGENAWFHRKTHS